MTEDRPFAEHALIEFRGRTIVARTNTKRGKVREYLENGELIAESPADVVATRGANAVDREVALWLSNDTDERSA